MRDPKSREAEAEEMALNASRQPEYAPAMPLGVMASCVEDWKGRANTTAHSYSAQARTRRGTLTRELRPTHTCEQGEGDTGITRGVHSHHKTADTYARS